MALTLTLEGGPAPVTDRTRRIARGPTAPRARRRERLGAARPGALPVQASLHDRRARRRMVDHRRKHQRRVRRRPGEAARARQLGPAARWQLGAHRRLSPAHSDRGVGRGIALAAPDLRPHAPARSPGARPGAAAHERGRVRDRVAAQVVDRRAGAAGSRAQRSDGQVRPSESLRGAGPPLGRRARATGAPARTRHATGCAGRSRRGCPRSVRPAAASATARPGRAARDPGPG